MKEDKQKARELVGRFMQFAYSEWDIKTGFVKGTLIQNAKACAIICVDEMIQAVNNIRLTTFNEEDINEELKDLQSVKAEIEKL
jgi:hypothetical protein